MNLDNDPPEMPVLGRERLGQGVRGKYLDKYLHGRNVVVLRPGLIKAFSTSEAVNEARANYLSIAQLVKQFEHPTKRHG